MKYVGSYILIVVLSAPFFYFLPVEVAVYYLESVKPILHEFHPLIYTGITSFHLLRKALPSLHTGIFGLAFLYSFKYTKSYSWYVGVTAFTIIIPPFI
jgi:hypothetical protein